MTLNLYGGTISSDGWDALIINTNAAKANLLGNVTFSYPSSKSAIKTRASGTIDSSGYTGGNIAVYYAKSYPSIGDIVVTNVTDANAGKFDLSTENDSACILKRSGNNLVYGKYSYDVAFNTNGGSAVGSQTVLDGADMMNIAVDPGHRRQGIAEQLIEKLIEGVPLDETQKTFNIVSEDDLEENVC